MTASTSNNPVYPPEDYKQKLLKEYDENTGIEKLRLLVSNANYCNESFNEQFTIEELIKIHRALALCAWDILPDSWTERQIQEALELGRVPTWNNDELPTYDDPPPVRVSDKQLRALRHEAYAAGDLKQVGLCNDALLGDELARADCARAIADATAQEEIPPPLARIYLTSSRKQWHHDLPPGWTEEAFERFDYVECAVFSKPVSELTDADRRLVDESGKPDESFIMPAGSRFIPAGAR